MPTFITYASYSHAGIKGLVSEPSDRTAAIKGLIEKAGGKLIAAHGGPAVAELQFPGAPGDYTLKVHYFDEADGSSAFTVRVEEPAADAKD